MLKAITRFNSLFCRGDHPALLIVTPWQDHGTMDVGNYSNLDDKLS